MALDESEGPLELLLSPTLFRKLATNASKASKFLESAMKAWCGAEAQCTSIDPI
jgi:hypothetical protein